MSIFAIGDTHLSLQGDKGMDVFPGWENYIERLAKGWKALVKDDDTVVLVGDISWALRFEDAVEDFRFLDSLPGKKLVLKGNHDFWWQTKTKNDAFLKEHGFDSISILFNNAYKVGDFVICGSRGWFFDACDENDAKVLRREAGRLQMSLDEGFRLTENRENVIVFLHYPPLTSNQVCHELVDVLQKEGVRRVYYAHLHGASHKFAFNGNHEGIDYRLVSADYLSFYPYPVEIF